MTEKRRLSDFPQWENGQKSRAFDASIFSGMIEKLQDMESSYNGQRMKAINPTVFSVMMDKLKEMEATQDVKTVDSRIVATMNEKLKDLEASLQSPPLSAGGFLTSNGGSDANNSLLLPPPPPPPSLTSSIDLSSSTALQPLSAIVGSGAMKNFSGNPGETFDVLLCYDGVAGSFKCPFECTVASSTPRELSTHAEQKHGVRFANSCYSCGAGFQSPSSLSFHTRTCGSSATAKVPEPPGVSSAVLPLSSSSSSSTVAAAATAATCTTTTVVTAPLAAPVLRNGGRCCPTLNYREWFLCGICAAVYLDPHSFRAHVFSEHASMCMVCRFDVQCDVTQHLAVTHPALVFPNAPPDISVLAIVSAPPFCPICLADFPQWSDVEQHKMNCSQQEVAQCRQEAAKEAQFGKIACELCKFSVGPDGVQAHFTSYHSRTCYVCFARFWDTTELKAHMFKHNEWLNSAFGGPEYYWQSSESGTKPFCHLCSRKTTAPGVDSGSENGTGAAERYLVSEFNNEADDLAYFDNWVDVESHYRQEHAPYMEPPMNVEDFWTFVPGLWNRKN